VPQINVKVIARASRCEIIPFNDGLKVKLTRPAVEGKANEQLCALLADYWHVPKKNVRILSGEHNSIKRIEWIE
jgi:uncharacterized protein (TIGR00251 family)